MDIEKYVPVSKVKKIKKSWKFLEKETVLMETLDEIISQAIPMPDPLEKLRLMFCGYRGVKFKIDLSIDGVVVKCLGHSSPLQDADLIHNLLELFCRVKK
jgi:hypothetical protein